MTDALAPVETLDTAGQEAVRAIYEAGFPPAHYSSWESVTSARTAGEEALVFTADGTPLGFVLVRSLVPTDRLFLRYLVVDEARRGEGVGGRVWQHLRDHGRRLDASVLVWDVEHPDEPGTDPSEADVRRRRIGFYERLGGVVLPVDDYTNPSLTDDGVDVERPMLLLATSLGDDPAVPTDDAAWVDGVVRDVQTYRWGR
ncbi:GNAT family N-acetyltransferase [Solicola sp. PLA-1-18]|uniref:GNAT family N-acetyltransferase n=1 Tax=Solicola sp. PLA-1-18 TaxID=3380532 RepID=UPI003B7E881C